MGLDLRLGQPHHLPGLEGDAVEAEALGVAVLDAWVLLIEILR